LPVKAIAPAIDAVAELPIEMMIGCPELPATLTVLPAPTSNDGAVALDTVTVTAALAVSVALTLPMNRRRPIV
jgi:hypothetical protein